MIQIFDVDRSLSVLGSKKDIIQMTGAEPIPLNHDYYKQYESDKGDIIVKAGMDEHLKAYLSKMFVKQKITVRNELFGVDTEEIRTAMRETFLKSGLKGIVVDSVSGMGEGVRSHLISNARFDQMTMDLWGKYGVRIGNLMALLREIPTQVFLTCHIDRVENDQGIQIEYPAIKGAQKTDALRWFDVIVYNKVVGNKIFWQVVKTDIRPFIRSRTPVPEWADQEYVDPDYLPVLRAYKGAATPLKMLVIGDSGTGKTTALKTMAPYVEAFKKAKTTQKPKAKEAKAPSQGDHLVLSNNGA